MHDKTHMSDAAKGILLEVLFPGVGGFAELIAHFRKHHHHHRHHNVTGAELPKFIKPAGGWHKLEGAQKAQVLQGIFPGIENVAGIVAAHITRQNQQRNAEGITIGALGSRDIQPIALPFETVKVDNATGIEVLQAMGVNVAANATGVEIASALGVEVKQAAGEMIQLSHASGATGPEVQLHPDAQDALYELVQLVDHDPKATDAVITGYGEKPATDLEGKIQQVVALAQKHGADFENQFLADVAKYKGFDIGKIFGAIKKAFQTIGKIFKPLVDAIKKAVQKHKAAKAAAAAPKPAPKPQGMAISMKIFVAAAVVAVLVGIAWGAGLFDSKKASA